MVSLHPDDAVSSALWAGDSLDTIMSQWKVKEGEVKSRDLERVSIKTQPLNFAHLIDFVATEYKRSKGALTKGATAHGMGMLHTDSRYSELVEFETILRREVFSRGHNVNQSLIGEPLAYEFSLTQSQNTSISVYDFVANTLSVDARMLGCPRYKLVIISLFMSLSTGSKAPGMESFINGEVDRFWKAIENKLNAKRNSYKRISI